MPLQPQVLMEHVLKIPMCETWKPSPRFATDFISLVPFPLSENNQRDWQTSGSALEGGVCGRVSFPFKGSLATTILISLCNWDAHLCIFSLFAYGWLEGWRLSSHSCPVSRGEGGVCGGAIEMCMVCLGAEGVAKPGHITRPALIPITLIPSQL